MNLPYWRIYNYETQIKICKRLAKGKAPPRLYAKRGSGSGLNNGPLVSKDRIGAQAAGNINNAPLDPVSQPERRRAQRGGRIG